MPFLASKLSVCKGGVGGPFKSSGNFKKGLLGLSIL